MITPKRKRNGKWAIRWREGGVQRQMTLDRKADADAVATEINRRLQTRGLVDLDRSEIRLTEFVVTDYWPLHAIPNLEVATRNNYANVWAKHLEPRVGTYRLRELTVDVITGLRAELIRRGVGEPTVRRALGVLQSILALAVRQGRLDANPVQKVRKPGQAPARRPVPLTPDVVEALRDQVGGGNACLISVLAYAGLRPEEALALTWLRVGAKAIDIAAKNVDGELLRWTKTRKLRLVDLLAPLAQDLAEWRLASGRRDGLVFPRTDGEPWRAHDYRNWRRRVFAPAAAALGLAAGTRPYDLRHSFASLLIWEGKSIAEVADQLGNSVEVAASTYTHVFKGFDPAQRRDAEDAIRQARAKRRAEGTG